MSSSKGGPVNEADFTRAVIDLARLRGWKVAHFRPARMQSGKWATPMQGDIGFPDLVLARHGTVLFVELKSEMGRLRAEQEDWGQHLHLHVWRPSQLRQIAEWLK